MTAATTSRDEIVRRVHRDLIGRDLKPSDRNLPAIAARVAALAPLLSPDQATAVAERVSRQLFGLGDLEPLLADSSITEVMINGPGPVWVERLGALSPTEVVLDEAMLRMIVERIVGPLGLRADRTQPFVDARLPDGSRVNIAVPPLALDGPYLTIRRFRASPHALADFCDTETERRLISAMQERRNVIVSGGTGSGKTSLLNALAAHIAPNERVVTVEDAAELRLPGAHTVRLEARPANAEGIGGVSIRTLLRNALRMRPDRIIVGEVRGAEAFDMVQAMNTGHNGSMSTCHANSPRDALARIEAMAMMGDVDLPVAVVRDHLESALDIVVHVARSDRGARRVQAVFDCAKAATTQRDKP